MKPACLGERISSMALPRILPTAVLLVVLELAACDSSPNSQYLTEEIPPCTPVSGSSVDPCDPYARPIWEGAPDPTPTPGPDDEVFDTSGFMREMLDGFGPGFVTHLVLRGTYLPGTVRCTADRGFRPPDYLDPDLYEEPSPRGRGRATVPSNATPTCA